MPGIVRQLAPLQNNILDGGTVTVGSTVLDSVLADEYGSVEWAVTFRNSVTGDRARFNIMACHNGTVGADATDGVYEVTGGAAMSTVTNQLTLVSDLSGAGTGQVLRLLVTVSSGTWTVDVARSSHIGSPA